MAHVEQDKGRWAARHALLVFYALAFGISWTGFIPEFAAMWGSHWFRSPLWVGLLVLPGVGPALAAWIAGASARGSKSGMKELRTSFTRQVEWKWWVLAVGLPASSFGAAWVWGGVLARGEVAVAGATAMSFLAALAVSLAANVWEEVGWRGFALVRLQRRFHPLAAALIVGGLWAAWHLPLLLIPQSAMSTYPVGLWATGTISHSIVLAWMFNRTQHSLGVVTVAHVSWNVFGALFGVRSWSVLAAVEVGVALAVLVLSRDGWELSAGEGAREG